MSAVEHDVGCIIGDDSRIPTAGGIKRMGKLSEMTKFIRSSLPRFWHDLKNVFILLKLDPEVIEKPRFPEKYGGWKVRHEVAWSGKFWKLIIKLNGKHMSLSHYSIPFDPHKRSFPPSLQVNTKNLRILIIDQSHACF